MNVFVALVIQQAKLKHHIVIAACLNPPYFTKLSHKRLGWDAMTLGQWFPMFWRSI
jgi:hypothetical protein